MSYSFSDAAVCHGPCVVMEKYSSPHWPSGLQPPASGSSPIDCSSGAFDVVPTYFRSAASSSLAWMQLVVTTPPHVGSAGLVACNSNPETSDWIARLPVPWLTPLPLSGRVPVWVAPEDISIAAGCVIVDA